MRAAEIELSMIGSRIKLTVARAAFAWLDGRLAATREPVLRDHHRRRVARGKADLDPAAVQPKLAAIEALDAEIARRQAEDGTLADRSQPGVSSPMMAAPLPPAHWHVDSGLWPRASTAGSLRHSQRVLAARKGWARRREEWESYLDLHGHAERLRAFQRIPLDELQGAQYWRLLGSVWIAVEDFSDRTCWTELLLRYPDHRAAMMTDAEHEKLSALPGIVEVWRGVGDHEYADGFSWTLDERTARRFAQRFTHGLLLRGEVAWSDIIAQLSDQEEEEIVVLTGAVRIVERAHLDGGDA
jgi:hypothetical protein